MRRPTALVLALTLVASLKLVRGLSYGANEPLEDDTQLAHSYLSYYDASRQQQQQQQETNGQLEPQGLGDSISSREELASLFSHLQNSMVEANGENQDFDLDRMQLDTEAGDELQKSDDVLPENLVRPANDPLDYDLIVDSLAGQLSTGRRQDANASQSSMSPEEQGQQTTSTDSDNHDQQQQHQQQANNKSPFPPAGRYGTAEYIDHPLALVGHQYVQGGAGEGRQLLGPDGTFENVQVIKTDRAVPSYCDPPNPCPIGYTAEDGCLEEFVNSASFSREYQAKQQCSCDNEHSLFNCASPVEQAQQKEDINNNDNNNNRQQQISQLGPSMSEHQLDVLARKIHNQLGGLAGLSGLVAETY